MLLSAGIAQAWAFCFTTASRSFRSRPCTIRTLSPLRSSALHLPAQSSPPDTGYIWWHAALPKSGPHRAELCCAAGLTISASPSMQRSRTSPGGGTSPLRNLRRSDSSIARCQNCWVGAGGGSLRCTVLCCWACWVWDWSSHWNGSYSSAMRQEEIALLDELRLTVVIDNQPCTVSSI